jgi:hypothetical protein
VQGEGEEADVETPVSSKVTVAAAAGAIVVVLVWLLDQFASIDVPTIVQGALVVIISAIAGWVKTDVLRDAGAAAVKAPADATVASLPLVTKAKIAVPPSKVSLPADADRDPRDGELGAVAPVFAVLVAVGAVLALLGILGLVGAINLAASALYVILLVAGVVLLAVGLVRRF